MASRPGTTDKPIVVWFRQDLRLADHRALTTAAASGAPVVPVYVLDEHTPRPWAPGGASRWWLHGSLASLASDLGRLGSALILRRGAARDEIPRLARDAAASAVYCSRGYEPWMPALEGDLSASLAADGIDFKRFGGALLAEPEHLRTKAGEPYRVYTPFWRSLADRRDPPTPLPAPIRLEKPAKWPASDDLPSWKLRPEKPDWAGGLRETWQPGEAGAHARCARFLDEALGGYQTKRDEPGVEGTSRLSPHLHFGEISPGQCWYAAKLRAAREGGEDEGLGTFLRELAWREFSHHLLFHWPDLPEKPFRPEFAAFPWARDEETLDAWRRGATGYPVVDAGMRQLWHTGWMHNRVRMVVASFLTKHLLIPWQDGEAWFWDTLVDADLANNAASWQWVAGSGADAAPYFRIFNPVKQGETFDTMGRYVRRWVPELARLPAPEIHAPWTASAELLAEAGVTLGDTYPRPVVDHAEARRRALAAYETVRIGGVARAETGAA